MFFTNFIYLVFLESLSYIIFFLAILIYKFIFSIIKAKKPVNFLNLFITSKKLKIFFI